MSFYLDGVFLIHKFTPMKDAGQTKSRVWQLLSERLQLTAKRSKELAGGRRLHIMDATAHGKGLF